MSAILDTESWEAWLARVEAVEGERITDAATIDRLYACYIDDIDPTLALTVLDRWPRMGLRATGTIANRMKPKITAPHWRKRGRTDRFARGVWGLVVLGCWALWTALTVWLLLR
jgi:hypothetical protein